MRHFFAKSGSNGKAPLLFVCIASIHG